MTERRRIAASMLVLAAACAVVALVAIRTLYAAAVKEQEKRLVEVAQGRARLIEAIAGHEMKYAHIIPAESDHGSAVDATLDQLKKAHSEFNGFGDTGEFVLAKLEGDKIVFLLRHRHSTADVPQSIPAASENAVPMQLALAGNSGTVFGRDYRGVEVLAAYEPIPDLGLAIVAKIDVAEIKAPFVRAGILVGFISFFIIITGAVLISRISTPIIKRLENYSDQLENDIAEREKVEAALKESERKYRQLFDLIGDPIFVHNILPDGAPGRFLDVNEPACSYLGYSKDELLKMGVKDISTEGSYNKGKDLIAELKKTGGIIFSSTHRHRDGTEIPVEIHAHYIKAGSEERILSVARDLTERVKSEQALKENEALLRTIFDNSPNCLFVKDLNGKYIFVNSTIAELYNTTAWEMIGRRDVDFAETLRLSRDDAERFFSDDQEVIRTRTEKFIPEEKFEMPDGTVRWFQTVKVPLSLPENPDCMLGIAVEITARKEAERELEYSERMLKFAIEQLPVPVIIALAPDVSIYRINDAAEQMLEKQTDDPHGIRLGQHRDFWPTFHPDGTPYDVEDLPLTRAVKEGVVTKHKEIIVRKSDGDHYISATAAPLFDENGHIIAGIVVFPEITEMKNTQLALRESEERFRTIFDYAPMSIALTDTRGRIIQTNRQFQEMLGYSREELLDMDIAEITPADDFDNEKQFFDKLRSREIDSFTIEKRYIRKDGAAIWASMTPSVLWDEDGEAEYIIGMIREITELKKQEEEKRRLQEQLQQSQKMEAVGRLAGGIAHDFNNMLTVIMGCANLVQMQIDENSEIYTDITEILNASERARELTMKLLTFSRKEKIHVKDIHIGRIVDSLTGMLDRSISKSIDISTNIVDDCVIRCDENQLQQALLNVCNNASDAMPAGGNLEISARLVEFEAHTCGTCGKKFDGAYCLVEVEDTGIGIASSMLKKIVEPFFTTKGAGEGTGLGLSTTHGIVENHDGHLHIYSEQGAGTSVKIYLPVSDADTTMAEIESSAANLRGTETILVVDDEQSILKTARRILDSMGYSVITAAGGSEAVSIFKEQHSGIDAVVLDLMMPGMDGAEVYSAIKQLDPGARIIVSSGYSIDGSAGHLLRQGADSFIQKPFSLPALCGEIRTVLDRRKNEH